MRGLGRPEERRAVVVGLGVQRAGVQADAPAVDPGRRRLRRREARRLLRPREDLAPLFQTNSCEALTS